MTGADQATMVEPSPVRQGRPVNLAKRDAVLEAARQQLLLKGFEGLSMEAVGAQTGVAKGTLYKSFPDRESLFEAVIDREAQAAAHPEENGTASTSDLRPRLVAFGERLVERWTDPELLASSAVFQMEAARRPDLALRVHEFGAARVLRELAPSIAEGAAEGRVTPDDTTLAAEDLLGLRHRADIERMRFGVAERTGPQDRHARARGEWTCPCAPTPHEAQSREVMTSRPDVRLAPSAQRKCHPHKASASFGYILVHRTKSRTIHVAPRGGDQVVTRTAALP